MSLKRYAAIFFLFLVLGAFNPIYAQVTKIDPLVHIFTQQINASASSIASKAISINAEGEEVIDCFVSVYDSAKAELIAERIKSLGGEVHSINGNVMTAFIPVVAIEDVAGWTEVKYIESGKPMLRKNDVSRVTVGTDSVQAGTGLDKRYDGSGVIVGIVDDTRPDWGHVDFQDDNGKSRVLFLWDKAASGNGVSEISGSTGLECTKAQIDASTCTAPAGGDTTSHSTHVGGTAAGDDATYTGSAPGADIIFVYNVETDADSDGNLATTIVDDVKYVFAKASVLKQPAVVNLSLGTSIGAHDNTSLMETSLNNLVVDTPGRAIANAAGNENFNPNDSGSATYAGIHGSVSVESSVDRAFDMVVRSGSSLKSLGSQVILDTWLSSTSTCTVELDAFDFAKTTLLLNMSPVSAGATGSASGAATTAGTVTLNVDFTDSVNANNGKKHAVATMTINSAVTNAEVQNLSFDLIFRGDCSGNVWLWPDRNSTNSFSKRFGGTDRGFGYTYVNGDSAKTITIPATASGLIAVASFMDRATWVDSTGVTHFQTATSGTDFTSLGATGGTLNAISLFSSLGPTADARNKPDIAAPGEAVVSSLSLNNNKAAGIIVNATHFKNEGTSMASPNVAGIAALMFQRNKCLTSNQIKTLITGSANTDSDTGTSLPDNTWGYGKVNALAAMKAVTAYDGPCTTMGSSGAPVIPQTTTTGDAASDGCSLIKNREIKFENVAASFLILFCVFWILDRRSRIR